jgi:hypothetical protein
VLATSAGRAEASAEPAAVVGRLVNRQQEASNLSRLPRDSGKRNLPHESKRVTTIQFKTTDAKSGHISEFRFIVFERTNTHLLLAWTAFGDGRLAVHLHMPICRIMLGVLGPMDDDIGVILS